MRKAYRVKKNDDFQAVFRKGRSVANRQFVVYALQKEGQPKFRIGLSVSKKIGNAVMRNQIKRYIREVFRELKDDIRNGYDYVIIARKPAAEMNYHEVKKSLQHVLRLGRHLPKKR